MGKRKVLRDKKQTMFALMGGKERTKKLLTSGTAKNKRSNVASFLTQLLTLYSLIPITYHSDMQKSW